MLKMIIVDDEYIILESLVKLIDWESVGVQVVGSADNGAAALDLTLKHRPDIILSDISMPFFNGLEMIKALRKNCVFSEVIFISAYSKFEYAREALKFGAFDYILKPINEKQLLETVKRCTDKITENKNVRGKAENWEHDIQSGNSECYNKISELQLNQDASFENTRQALLSAVKTTGKNEIEAKVLEFFAVINCDDSIFDAEAVKLRCVELLDFILRNLEDYSLQDYLENPQKTLSAKKTITSGTSLDDVFSITCNLIINIALCVKEILTNSPKRLVSLAIAHIQENYKNDITLSQTAEQLYISPTYLSKIFSAEMHKTFSHYILEYRIDMAKKLLRVTNMKIYEVASKVGYGDVAHFSKSFKQITGITPMQYREHPHI